MTEPHRQPSMPRVLWLERDRVPPPPPAPPPPEPPQLFRPKSPVRERLFPAARPLAQAIVRVREGETVRLLHRLRPPAPRPRLEEEDIVALRPAAPRAGTPACADAAPSGRDWLNVAAGRGRRAAGVPVARILAAVAEHYEVEVEEILAHRRSAAVVVPRQVAMYLAKALTARSLPDLGQRFGGRDHTTILHGVRKIAALMRTDAALAGDVAGLTARLKGRGEAAAHGGPRRMLQRSAPE